MRAEWIRSGRSRECAVFSKSVEGIRGSKQVLVQTVLPSRRIGFSALNPYTDWLRIITQNPKENTGIEHTKQSNNLHTTKQYIIYHYTSQTKTFLKIRFDASYGKTKTIICSLCPLQPRQTICNNFTIWSVIKMEPTRQHLRLLPKSRRERTLLID